MTIGIFRLSWIIHSGISSDGIMGLIRIKSIIIIALIFSVSSVVLAADQQDFLSIPKVGKIKITAHEAVPVHDAGPFLTVETTDGKLLKRIDFALDGPEGHPNTLRFMIFHQTSAPGPLIVALETTPAVSAVLFKTVILGSLMEKFQN